MNKKNALIATGILASFMVGGLCSYRFIPRNNYIENDSNCKNESINLNDNEKEEMPQKCPDIKSKDLKNITTISVEKLINNQNHTIEFEYTQKQTINTEYENVETELTIKLDKKSVKKIKTSQSELGDVANAETSVNIIKGRDNKEYILLNVYKQYETSNGKTLYIMNDKGQMVVELEEMGYIVLCLDLDTQDKTSNLYNSEGEKYKIIDNKIYFLDANTYDYDNNIAEEKYLEIDNNKVVITKVKDVKAIGAGCKI